MLVIGEKEADAVRNVIKSGKMFRYHEGGECDRFEKRWGEYTNTKYVCMTASGTNSLTAALAGLDVGPGDEVLVPALTYMATPIAVLAVGAIPVIVDVDDSTCMDPIAMEDAIGPRTKAAVPVHMWGQPCDMRSIMRVARKHKLLICEDACQGVGGGYEGKMLGSIGHVGGFSFNFFKNMTCGEGGAVTTNKRSIAEKVKCMVDPCSFYWRGKGSWRPFVANGARASEFEGAIMNVQLDRLPSMLKKLRAQKKRVLKEAAKTDLTLTPVHSLDYECATCNSFLLPTEKQAEDFAAQAGGGIMGKTGRHVYLNWEPIFEHSASHHDAMNPFKFKENKGCRMKYTEDMCARSLDILNRTVMIGNHPERKSTEVTALIKRIKEAAKAVLG
ncbi:MAG: DegT/DnrJ/EryC1/StrS family aminotransferase [Planctomycetota bacterium]|jgi:dTDP-4-amino-4,6-dideoxygalactose transaminase|nr:DegT/DnrJ/EryC1/StrS family aminotransferase [Planctomycetota bacterium]